MLYVLPVTLGLLLFAGVDATAADGAAIFKSHCAKCHGETGQADTPVAKAMKTPVLTGNADVAGTSDADLLARVKEVKKHGAVKLDDTDLAAAVTYTKQLAGGK